MDNEIKKMTKNDAEIISGEFFKQLSRITFANDGTQSELNRRLAITRTELEKLTAYFELFLLEAYEELTGE